MNTKLVVGISGCLSGAAVRFDGGHTRMDFVMDSVAASFAYKPTCPEVALGLPGPPPASPINQTTCGV
ncbi:DUF523 domain-containing protein, partial [Salmonella enterica subsp. enterica serovar Infantis]|uniref:2-thiouracil desulfurase family protein n=1 Tax=Salmonella enterica TaxID=28901 RepID=UPI001CAA6619